MALLSHQGFLKYSKNAGWLMGEHIVRLLSGIFIAAIVARYLGPQEFGLYSYLFAFIGLFMSFTHMGLNSIIVKHIVEKPAEYKAILGSAFVIKSFAAIVTLIAIYFVSSVILQNDDQTVLYLLIIASATLFQGFDVIQFYFNAKVQNQYSALCRIIQIAISAIIKIYLVYIEADLKAFVIVALIDQLLLFLFYAIAYRLKGESIFKISYNFDTVKSLLRDSMPIMLSAIIGTLYLKIDQVMIQNMLDNEQLGYYSAAVKISTALYFFPNLILGVFFPAIIQAKARSVSHYFQRMTWLYRFIFITSLAITSIFFLLAPLLIYFLFGPQFKQSVLIFEVHVFSLIPLYINSVWYYWIINENKQSLVIKISIVCTVLNISFNWIFIQFFGAIGAAYASVITYIILIILMVYSYKPRLTLGYFKYALKL